MRIRYAQWDGTQDPLGPDLSTGDLMEAMSNDLLSGRGADRALSRLIRRGMRGRFTGLDALRARLQQARRREQDRLNLQGPLQQIQARLEEILEAERRRLSLSPEDDARLREQFLESLPPDAAGAIKELREYRFVDPEAQRKFDELMDWLEQQVLGSYFRKMAQGMKSLSPEQLQSFKDMLADLNSMIEARDRGEAVDFEGFMRRHGDLFPDQPKTMDELLESMARRMAAMSRLMASLSPEQRAELEALAREVLEDLDLAFELDRLARSLSELYPRMPWDDPALMGGDQSLPMQATVDALERLSDYEELDRSMRGDYAGAALEDVDEDRLRRTLGEAAVRDIRRLKDVERALERVGLVTRSGGRLRVTPRGARRLGERALVRLFEQLRQDREGAHDARKAGGVAEPTGGTRPWRFGDSAQIAVQKTVFNAVLRGGPSGRPRLRPEDFELVEGEKRTEAATALLLDLSFSMPLRGHWVPAKKMALALHALIEGRYPNDRLYLIGFSDYARQIRPEDLAGTGWERVYGTNMQHAFNLAGRLLANHPRASRQVIMVTDGEPTAHLEEGEAFFSWPPVPETIRRTLSEAMRLAKTGVTINVFMLEDTASLARFMQRLARLTRGRVFQTAGEGLGEFVIRDYVARRGS
ncbi:MAG: vWA domain-containing protein [Actinomycetota bacterium]